MIRSFGSHVRRNLIAYAALFFALGGTSFAAVQALPRNSVGSPQIKNRSIQRIDISRRAAASLRGQRGSRGLQGVQGVQGAQGIQGIQGIQGVKGDKGDTGPTYGAADGAGDVPQALPSLLSFGDTAVNLPTAGALYVVGRVNASYACNASGSCTHKWALSVDNTPVPHSSTEVTLLASQSGSDHLSFFGIAPNVSAGAHTLRIRTHALGNWSSQSNTNYSISAILLGGAAGVTSSSSSRSAVASASHR